MQSYTEDRAIAYVEDGYINAPLSVALRILADLKQVFKDDAGLEPRAQHAQDPALGERNLYPRHLLRR